MNHHGLLGWIAQFLGAQLNLEEHLAIGVASIVVVVLAMLISAAAIRLNHLLFQKIIGQKELHLKFARSLLDLLFIVCGLLLIGIFFGVGNSLGRILLGSTGLIVAIIGFAAQSALGDVIAGLMMGLSRPFKLGDRIILESSGISGTVRDMTIRHTVIHQFDGLYVIIPNSVLNKEVIHNNSYKGELTASYLEFDISYDSDIRKAMKIIHDAVANDRYALEYVGDNPENKNAAVYVTNFGESSVKLRTTVWARNSDENFLACSAIRYKVKKEFERQGVEIPFNYLNVVMRDKKEENSAADPVRDEMDTIIVSGQEDEQLRAVFKQVEAFCRKYRVSRKESGYVRMLSEELTNMMRSRTGTVDGDFSIQLKERTAEMHYRVPAKLDPQTRRELMAVGNSRNKNMGMAEMIRFVFDEYRLGKRSDTAIWSLRRYEKERQAGNKEVDPGVDLERSIIENFADDVQISMSNNAVEMIVLKKLWSVRLK